MDRVPGRVGDGEASGKKIVRDKLKHEDDCHGATQKRRCDARTDACRRQEGLQSLSLRGLEDSRLLLVLARKCILEIEERTGKWVGEGLVKDSDLGTQLPPTYDIPPALE